MSRETKSFPLIARQISDDNFAHCVRMVAACAWWSETAPASARLEQNARNMVQIPMEVAFGFMKLHAQEQTPLGEACSAALKQFDEIHALYAKAAHPLPGDHP